MPVPTIPHPRERDIRRALLARDEAEHAGCDDTLVVPEMGLNAGLVRLDLAVINGNLHGYEIKSAADTLLRLPTQAAAYSRACDQVTIVTAVNHLDRVREMVPSWWGILRVESKNGEARLVEERVALRNPAVDSYAIAQLLWREEALQLLEEHGMADGVRSKPRKILWRALAAGIPSATLAEEVRATLRHRRDWRAGPTSP